MVLTTTKTERTYISYLERHTARFLNTTISFHHTPYCISFSIYPLCNILTLSLSTHNIILGGSRRTFFTCSTEGHSLAGVNCLHNNQKPFCMCEYVRVYMYQCVHVCVCMCMRVCACMHVQVCVGVCVCACVHINVYKCIPSDSYCAITQLVSLCHATPPLYILLSIEDSITVHMYSPIL